jgi:hypothetical protein
MGDNGHSHLGRLNMYHTSLINPAHGVVSAITHNQGTTRVLTLPTAIDNQYCAMEQDNVPDDVGLPPEQQPLPPSQPPAEPRSSCSFPAPP